MSRVCSCRAGRPVRYDQRGWGRGSRGARWCTQASLWSTTAVVGGFPWSFSQHSPWGGGRGMGESVRTHTLLKMDRYYNSPNVSLLGHVSILLSKLSDCPNTDTSLCYCNYLFLTVYIPPQIFPFHPLASIVWWPAGFQTQLHQWNKHTVKVMQNFNTNYHLGRLSD